MVALNDIIDQKNKVNTFYAKRMKRKKKGFQVDLVWKSSSPISVESPRLKKWYSSW